MKYPITIEIDSNQLPNVTDCHLAELWHVAQANPAPMEDHAAGDVVEYIGREIIRRFLKETGPSLWNHQGRHAVWCELQALREGSKS
jgi:hypothetical protein